MVRLSAREAGQGRVCKGTAFWSAAHAGLGPCALRACARLDNNVKGMRRRLGLVAKFSGMPPRISDSMTRQSSQQLAARYTQPASQPPSAIKPCASGRGRAMLQGGVI